MFVCCECCVLSDRGLCDELITRPEESYRLWCVVVCDLSQEEVPVSYKPTNANQYSDIHHDFPAASNWVRVQCKQIQIPKVGADRNEEIIPANRLTQTTCRHYTHLH